MMKEPDEATLTQWFDNELEGEQLQAVEAWVQAHPEWLEERNEWGALRAAMQDEISAEQEVPHAEFFASRISHEISALESPTERGAAKPSPWKAWFLPVGATAAALALGFFGGLQMGGQGDGAAPVVSKLPAASSESVLFTPDREVKAELVEGTGATLILLEGVHRLPSDLDLVGHVEPSDDYWVNTKSSRKGL